MAHVTIPIDDDLLHSVQTHPEDFGLLSTSTIDQRFEALVKAGARFLREQQLNVERAALYAEWADDPEMLHSAEHSARAAIALGVL